MTLNQLVVRLQTWNLGNVEYFFITLTHMVNLTRSSSTWKCSIYNLNRTVQSFIRDYYHCYFTHLGVFHTSVSWWFSNGVWVTVSPRDSFYYSGRSQQFWRVDCLNLPTYFQIPHGDYIECANYNWYNRFFHYYYYYYYYLLIRVFNINVSWWSFTGVWATASLLKSPGLFSVFWPFL